MKLRKFNAERSRGYINAQAMVTVTIKGAFSFNKKAISELQLKPGIKVNLLQDGEHPVDWYMEKTTEKSGMPIRNYSNKQLLFTNKHAATEIFKSLNLFGDRKSIRIPISTVPVEEGKYFAFITKKVVQNNPVNNL